MTTNGVEVKGLDELKRKFAELPKAMRKRVLRNALAAGAREVRDAAKRAAPVMSLGTSLNAPYRKPGTVKQAIRVRTSKADRQQGDVGVFVNVKPLKGGSAKNPNDPYYWRWLEFGTKKMRAMPFLEKAADRLPQALAIFEARIAKWLTATNATGKIIP